FFGARGTRARRPLRADLAHQTEPDVAVPIVRVVVEACRNPRAPCGAVPGATANRTAQGLGRGREVVGDTNRDVWLDGPYDGASVAGVSGDATNPVDADVDWIRVDHFDKATPRAEHVAPGGVEDVAPWEEAPVDATGCLLPPELVAQSPPLSCAIRPPLGVCVCTPPIDHQHWPIEVPHVAVAIGLEREAALCAGIDRRSLRGPGPRSRGTASRAASSRPLATRSSRNAMYCRLVTGNRLMTKLSTQ